MKSPFTASNQAATFDDKPNKVSVGSAWGGLGLGHLEQVGGEVGVLIDAALALGELGQRGHGGHEASRVGLRTGPWVAVGVDARARLPVQLLHCLPGARFHKLEQAVLNKHTGCILILMDYDTHCHVGAPGRRWDLCLRRLVGSAPPPPAKEDLFTVEGNTLEQDAGCSEPEEDSSSCEMSARCRHLVGVGTGARARLPAHLLHRLPCQQLFHYAMTSLSKQTWMHM